MLKQRIITALILVAALLLVLFNDNAWYWRGFVGVAILLGFYEWLKFCGISDLGTKAFSIVLFLILAYCLYAAYMPIELGIIVLCLVWLLLFVFTFTAYLQVLHKLWFKVLIGVITLAGSAWLVVEFKTISNGAWWVFGFLLTVSAADIGAYFTGKRFGKTKLAPNISPGKTIEGLIGGLLIVIVIFAPILFSIFESSAAVLLLFTIVVTALASVAGDLFESKLKRYVGLKDSSQILPGHGGILDRIDGMLAGAPFFAAGLLLLGYLS